MKIQKKAVIGFFYFGIVGGFGVFLLNTILGVIVEVFVDNLTSTHSDLLYAIGECALENWINMAGIGAFWFLHSEYGEQMPWAKTIVKALTIVMIGYLIQYVLRIYFQWSWLNHDWIFVLPGMVYPTVVAIKSLATDERFRPIH